MKTFEPILVRVTATEQEEEETRDPEETYTSSIEIAFVIMDSDMMIPKFNYEQWVIEGVVIIDVLYCSSSSSFIVLAVVVDDIFTVC